MPQALTEALNQFLCGDATKGLIRKVLLNLDDIQVLPDGQEYTSGFWSVEEVRGYLNEAVDVYGSQLLLSGEGHFEKTVLMDTEAQQAQYQLPEDLFKINQVLFKGSLGDYIPLAYVRDPRQPQYTAGGAWNLGYPAHYYFQSQHLVLNPVPASRTYQGLRVDYATLFPVFEGAEDKLGYEFRRPYTHLLVVYATICALNKDRSDTKEWKERLAVLEAVFQQALENRSNDPEIIRSCSISEEEDYYGGIDSWEGY